MSSLVEKKIEKYLPKNRVKKVLDTSSKLDSYTHEKNNAKKELNEYLLSLVKNK